MKFGMGSNAERTQKYGGSKYKMTYIRPNIYINKQTSPIFNCVTPVSVSLAKYEKFYPIIRKWVWSDKGLDVQLLKDLQAKVCTLSFILLVSSYTVYVCMCVCMCQGFTISMNNLLTDFMEMKLQSRAAPKQVSLSQCVCVCVCFFDNFS